MSTNQSSYGPGIIKRGNAYTIDPKSIKRRDGWNPRTDYGNMDELEASIKQHGVRKPLRVKRKGDGFELVDGDRRLTCVERLMKKGHSFPDGIRADIESEKTTDAENLVRMFLDNDGSKPFTPMEEASAFQRMRDELMSLKDIATAVGRSAVHVSNTMALIQAAPEVQEAVKSGVIKGTVARQIAVHARGDAGKQKELVEAAKAAGKDKAKRSQVKGKIDTVRRAKAAVKGRELKIKALDDAQLSSIGATVSKSLTRKMKAADLPVDTDLQGWCKDDANLTMAFEFGVLQGLKAAAGAQVRVTL